LGSSQTLGGMYKNVVAKSGNFRKCKPIVIIGIWGWRALQGVLPPLTLHLHYKARSLIFDPSHIINRRTIDWNRTAFSIHAFMFPILLWIGLDPRGLKWSWQLHCLLHFICDQRLLTLSSPWSWLRFGQQVKSTNDGNTHITVCLANGFRRPTLYRALSR